MEHTSVVIKTTSTTSEICLFGFFRDPIQLTRDQTVYQNAKFAVMRTLELNSVLNAFVGTHITGTDRIQPDVTWHAPVIQMKYAELQTTIQFIRHKWTD